jgi:alanine racemase
MGIPYHEALPFIEKVSSLKGLSIKGISTTLTEDDEFDREQLRRFLRLCREAESRGISLGLKHAASSDGMLDLPSSRLDMVRPGIALYGYYPSEKTQKEDRFQLRPVLQLKSRVVATKTLRPGDSLTYHRKYTAKKREKIAVVPVGYSDGYPSNAVNKASVLIRERRFPLIAAITANHCLALLKENSPVSTGDEVVLLGIQGKEKITADDIARWAESSSYKILIGLNPLLPRNII